MINSLRPQVSPKFYVKAHSSNSINDPWSYVVVEPIMPDRSKVRRQTKRDTGVTPRVDSGGFLPGRVCSSDVPVQATRNCGIPEEDPTSLEKAKLESSTPAEQGLISGQGRGNRSNEIPGTWHQGQLIAGPNGVLSSAHVSTVGGIRHTDDVRKNNHCSNQIKSNKFIRAHRFKIKKY